MQPTLPLGAFIERCKFCDHQLDGRSKHFCTTCLPPLSQWANPKDYAKQYQILRCAIGVSQEGRNKCRIPSTHPAYIHPTARAIQKNCSQCGTQFQTTRVGSNHCSYECSRVTALDKLRQGRLTRIQIQADELFPRSDVDLTAFAALVTDFLSKQDHTSKPQEDARPKCNMCQEPFTRIGKSTKSSYCKICVPKIRRWYNYRDNKPELAKRPCNRCSTIFRPDIGAHTRFCSTSCKAANREYVPLICKLIECRDCKMPTRPKGPAGRCNHCQFIATSTRRNANSAKRRHIECAGDKSISWRTVGERDSWICHLCSRKVSQQAGKAKSPKGATVDHLIPIGDGGLHVWDNVALAHRCCNVNRGASGIAQLKLIS